MPTSALLQAAASVAVEASRYAGDRLLPSTRALPGRARELTPEWLEAALGLAPGTVAHVDVIEQHAGTAARARLAVGYRHDGANGVDLPATLFAKLAPSTFAGRLFMNLMGLGSREVLAYQRVVPHVVGLAPRCYAAGHDPRRGRAVLVLEDLGARGCEFRDITSPATAEEADAVMRTLARLHAAFWTSPRFDTDLAALNRRPPVAVVVGGKLVSRALAAVPALVADLVPNDVQRESAMLVEQQAAVNAYWQSVPATLIHGDTHLGNLYFDSGEAAFFDWQNAERGPAVHDVAYFLGPSLTPEARRTHEGDLLKSYCRALADEGVSIDPDLLWDQYRASMARFYIGAVVTAAFGDRLQRAPIVRAGVERAVAAVTDLDSFAAVGQLSKPFQ